MKIGKAFLIASSVVLGLAVVGNEAGAWHPHIPSVITSGATYLRNQACIHSCAESKGAGACFLGDQDLLNQLASGIIPSSLSKDDVICLQTYCNNTEAKAPTTTIGKYMKTLKGPICKKYTKGSPKGHSSRTHRKSSS